MEVRVMEEGHVQVNPNSLEPTDVNATTVDVPIKSPQLTTVSQEPVEPIVHAQLNAASSADKTHDDHAELGAAGDGGETGLSFTMQSDPVLYQTTDADWQDMLSQEINKKKLELSLRAGKELEAQNHCDGLAPADGAPKSTNQIVVVAENGKKIARVRAPPIIRHRYLRTGALGPTMALLRASQIL